MLKSALKNAESSSKKTFSCEEAVDAAGFGWYQWKILVVCGFAWAADALEIMLISFLLPAIEKEYRLDRTFDSTNPLIVTNSIFVANYFARWVVASVGSAIFAGIMIGSFIFGRISDRYGRRIGFLATTGSTYVFGILSALSPNVWVLAFLRGMTGVSLGGAPVAFSLFAEYLPTNKRGVPLILFELCWTFGTLAEAGLAWAVLPTLGWRYLLFLSAIPLFFLVLYYPWLPESPRFLLVQGKDDEALEQLEALAKANGKSLPEGTLRPLVRGGTQPSFMELFSPELRVTTLLLWVIWFCNSFTYYGIVLLTPQLFDTKSSNSNYLSIFVTTSAEIPGLFFAALLIDTVGRKKTQSILFLVCCICTVLMVLKHLHEAILLAFAFGARMAIMGAFCTTYAYTPEVYPTSLRTTGVGIAAAVAKFAGIVTPFIADVLQEEKEGFISLLIYAGACLLAAVSCMMLPIETYKRGLEDVLVTNNPRNYGTAVEDPRVYQKLPEEETKEPNQPVIDRSALALQRQESGFNNERD